MESLKNDDEELTEMSKWSREMKMFSELAGPGSKTAERVVNLRASESQKPEGERICYDPYAIYFMSPGILEWAVRNPEKVKEIQETNERILPGLDNSIIARVRYFDDFIMKSIDEGLEQLVILGAGYDSRPYRIGGLERIKTFEVDHPGTQAVKIEKVKKIFGSLQDHVVFVPVNLGVEDLGQKLLENGYDPSKKSLFIMEGLSYFIPLSVIDEILSFIAENSSKGSCILFDYYPGSVVDGTCNLEMVKNLHKLLMQVEEPLKFGIKDGMIEAFLMERGFSQVHNVTSLDYKRAYFHGVNEGRNVCRLLNFVHAVVGRI